MSFPVPNATVRPVITTILTHPGGAHKDEFLACCVLVARHESPIVRREPTAEDLENPATVVVDVGGEHQRDRSNFDHHQFPRDQKPCCALSLVLQDLGLYDAARDFCDWLEPAEWFDCRGPNETARHLGVDVAVIHQLASPIDLSLLHRFAGRTEIAVGDPLWHVMGMIGEDMVGYVEGLERRLAEIADNCAWWTVSGSHGDFEVLFLPRTDPLPPEPSAGLGRFIERQGKAGRVQAMVYPDRRGPGYALARYNDSPSHDFSLLGDLDDISFAHVRGFVAKTTADSEARLRELLALAQVAPAQTSAG